MARTVLLGAVQNSCLGLLGLSLSYFHLEQRGGNSSEPRRREIGRVNQGLISFSGLSPDGGPHPFPVPCPSQTFLGT